MKENIAVIYGGKSVEHDISVITGLQVIKNLSQRYSIIPIYIEPNGEFCVAENLDEVNTYLDFKNRVRKKQMVTFIIGEPYIIIEKGKKFLRREKISCAVLCVHGRNGEDGSLQGLLQLCNIPYTSPNVMSSAMCMDKSVTKEILRNFKIKTPEFMYFYSKDYLKSKQEVLANIEAGLGFPVVVKPCNLGSSVGISVCENLAELEKAILNALQFDEKFIVEKFIANAREFCCAVIKLKGERLPSKVSEVTKNKIFTFEDKYLNKKLQKNSLIETSLLNKIKKLAVKTYDALECDGVVRIDFLYDGSLYVNELNTIPGSLAFNLFEVPFHDLLDSLIIEAKARQEANNKNIYEFSSSALKMFSSLDKNKYTK